MLNKTTDIAGAAIIIITIIIILFFIIIVSSTHLHQGHGFLLPTMDVKWHS